MCAAIRWSRSKSHLDCRTGDEKNSFFRMRLMQIHYKRNQEHSLDFSWHAEECLPKQNFVFMFGKQILPSTFAEN
jgi:hypothetical protein